MKKLFLSLCSLCLIMSGTALNAETVVRSFYFDFGMSGNSRGELTTGADVNGNYWNNIGDQEVTSNKPSLSHVYDLVDATNEATSLTLQLSGTAFTANGLSGGGGFLTPDTALLGDLAVATATEDYLFASNSEHCSMVISGLDPQKGYQFKIFGSRLATDVRISDYTLRGKWAVQGILQAAGTGIGANGENQNTSEVWLSPVISPAADGTISLTVHRNYAASQPYFPINCMRMQELTDLHVADAEIYVDCGHSDGNNGELTAAPDANGIYWVNLYDNAISAEPVALTYSDGAKVNNGANITITTAFSRNGYNNGGNTAETYSALLGVFGQKSVAGDYFFTNNGTSRMQFNGLNPQKAYVFWVFGSRAYNSSFGQTVDKLRIEGENTVTGLHHTGGNGMCYSGATNGWNEDAFTVLDPVFPSEDGTLVLTLSGERGSYQHINAMRIVEYSDYQKPGQVEVVNYESILLKGTAVEGGEVKMTLRAEDVKTEGTSFQTFLRLTNGGTMSFETTEGEVLSSNSCAFEDGIYRIVYDTEKRTFSSLKLERFGIVGNVTSAGWNAAGVAMTYRGNGVWRDTLDLPAYTGSDAERGQFCFNSSWDYTVKARNGVEGMVGFTPDQSDCGFAVEDIYMRHGKKDVMVDMQNMVYSIECMDIADNRISFFGSSVCNGQGATDMHGYAYQYTQLLAARHEADDTLPDYEYSNIAINGNNTLNLLARYQGHLVGDCGKYVVIGLGLGNEGIHGAANQQAIYNQWKNNMDSLIRMMQAEGKVVVATNNYPRGDYNASDYGYVKQMNIEMHEWGIPTVNFLGAIDNCKGDGQWADGYQNGDDVYHPNTAGHTEMMHAIVPSLFDALEAGKPQPKRIESAGTKLDTLTSLTLVPEDEIHSFAISIRLKTTTADGIILTTEAGEQKIELPVVVTDGQWHNLTLSYYNAAGKIYYYVDGVQAGSEDRKMLLKSASIGKTDMEVADLMLWRAALNADEVKALTEGKMLQSSLELYCPLNDGNTDNLAQSTNVLNIVKEQNAPSFLNDVQVEQSATKYVENGIMKIRVNGVSYTLLGTQIK